MLGFVAAPSRLACAAVAVPYGLDAIVAAKTHPRSAAGTFVLAAVYARDVYE